MRLTVIFKTLGSLLMLFSFSMLPPVIVATIYKDSGFSHFLFCFGITFLAGFLLWYIFRHQRHELNVKDGFLLVSVCWIVLSIFAAFPFLFELHHHISIAGAFFEAFSGLTSTGATILSNLELLSHSLLYYRQQLEFLGGMGIVVLAVAILPALGIGGLQLYSKEITGPVEIRLTPRIAQTARALWMIYCGLTFLCAFCYWLTGMTVFDAICESFATVSTGGFSIHSESFAYYSSHLIHLVAVIFMVLGGINFGVHFHCLGQRKFSCYSGNTEVRTYLTLIGISFLVAISILLIAGDPQYYDNAFFDSLFSVVSVSTTTGFTTASFHRWPTFLPFLFVLLALIGGCAGSTAGGLKVIRFIVLKKQAIRETKRLIHPNIVYPIKLDKPISFEILQSIWGFTAVYLGMLFVLTFVLVGIGLNLGDAFFAVITCISSTGAGITQISREFMTIGDSGLYVLIFTMLLGRLEIFTILLLFVPEFWRR
jgi:trk system potassium uptake protein TrkH